MPTLGSGFINKSFFYKQSFTFKISHQDPYKNKCKITFSYIETSLFSYINHMRKNVLQKYVNRFFWNYEELVYLQ